MIFIPDYTRLWDWLYPHRCVSLTQSLAFDGCTLLNIPDIQYLIVTQQGIYQTRKNTSSACSILGAEKITIAFVRCRTRRQVSLCCASPLSSLTASRISGQRWVVILIRCYFQYLIADYSLRSFQWAPELAHHLPSAPVLVVGTKVDLRNDATIIDALRDKWVFNDGRYIGNFN